MILRKRPALTNRGDDVAARSEATDEPISTPAEDSLGRSPFAAAVARTILDASPRTSFRIGIYGPWGAGKTSVMRLVDEELKSKGRETIWLHPWLWKSADELPERLTDELAAKLGVRRRKDGTLAAGIGRAADKWATHIPSRTLELATQLIGRGSSAVAGQLVQKENKRFAAAIIESLREQPVVVFIDDLDRLRPDAVPTFLLIVRDAANLPNIQYVIGVSPGIVERGLQSIHGGWETSQFAFLEKIIEYPWFLPRITKDAFRRFTRKELFKLGDTVDHAAFGTIERFLPRSPRQAKLSIRYLAQLKPILDRFLPSEVEYSRIYLVHLLKLEFPDEASRLAADSKALKELDAWVVEKWLREKKKIPQKPARFERYSPKGKQQRKRFVRLCHGIRLHRSLSDYRMADLLNLMERPPEFTWREIQTLYEATKDQSADESARRVAEAIEKDGGTSKTRVTALFHKLVEFRERNIGHAVEQDLTSEIEEVLREVRSITQLIRQLVVDASVVDRGMLGAQEWYAIMRHARRWSTWTAPKEYIATRRDERELLSELSRTLSSDAQVEVVGMQVSQYDPGGGRGSTREFDELLEEVLAKFEITVCDRLVGRVARGIGRFARPRGTRRVGAPLAV